VAVLCGSMMLANIPQKKNTSIMIQWSGREEPVNAISTFQVVWPPPGVALASLHPFSVTPWEYLGHPWSILVYRWWTVMDPYRSSNFAMAAIGPPLFSALFSLQGRAGTGAWDESIGGWLPLAGTLQLHGPLGPGKACLTKVLGVTKDQQRGSIFLYSNHVIFACYLMHFLLSVLHVSGAFTIMAEYDVTADLAPLCAHT
jgi:hypothetical protein